jgi:hypothetical protein
MAKDIFQNIVGGIGGAIAAPIGGFFQGMDKATGLDTTIKQSQLRRDLENAIYAGRPDIAQQLLVEHFTKTGRADVLQDPMIQNALASIPQQTASPMSETGGVLPQSMGGSPQQFAFGAGAQRPQPQGGVMGGLEVFNQPNVGKTWDVNKGIGPEYLNKSQFDAKTLSGASPDQQLQSAGAFASTYAGQDVQSDYSGKPMGPLQTQRLGQTQQTTQADIESKRASGQSSLASAAESRARTTDIPLARQQAGQTAQFAGEQAFLAQQNKDRDFAQSEIPTNPLMGLTQQAYQELKSGDINKQQYADRLIQAAEKARPQTTTNIDMRPIPTATVEKIAGFRDLSREAKKALKLAQPNFTGLGDSNSWKLWLEDNVIGNPQGKQSFKNALGDLKTYVYNLTGAAFNTTDIEILAGLIPDITMNDKEFVTKLTNFIDLLDNRHDTLLEALNQAAYNTGGLTGQSPQGQSPHQATPSRADEARRILQKRQGQTNAPAAK